MNPYRIGGPAVISFSGGRTSGFMLRQVLDAYDGGLPETLHVLFANTGKEDPRTLDFVADVGRAWQVPIHWIERDKASGFREVTHETASRNGVPFAALIRERRYLPNPVTRYCTTELKIRPMEKWMRGHGYADWTNVVGIRADEPRRAARMRDRNKEGRWDIALPLFEAGVTKADVDRFWKAQTFDLRLAPWEGNCDLCFLKSTARRMRVIEDHPERAAWWIDQEAAIGATFRIDTPPYRRLAEVARRQLRLPQTEVAPACDSDTIGDCFCGEGD